MRFPRFRPSAALFALAAVALPAIGSPAMPHPLERVVWDADLVVVVRIETPPEHRGADFTFAVEEVLKGEAGEGALRARSHVYFNGCMPPPEGTPPPPATEARGERVLLFLERQPDAGYVSHDPIVLKQGERAGAWFYFSHDALLAPEAVRELVRLSGNDCERSATACWKAGLRSGNPLLAAALLHRIAFADGTAEYYLGDELGERSQNQFEVARPHLLPVVAELAASEEPSLRHLALRAARACVPPTSEAERAAFRDCADAAVVALRESDPDTRTEALRFLVAFGDTRAPGEIVAALDAALSAHDDIAGTGRDLVREHPDLRDEMAELLLKRLDSPWGVAAFRTVFAQKELADAAACRAWWAKETR